MEGVAPFHQPDDLVQIEIPELNVARSTQPASEANQGPVHYPASRSTSLRRSSEEKPAEYALHILFTQFVRYTERKLSFLSSPSMDSKEPSVEKVLGQGADPEFDKILTSLGHIARRKPKPVIDSVMYWRKSKSDQVAAAQSPAVQRQAERKSLISIFVLCRVLMEVVRQTPPDILGDDLSEKLEDIVFKQLVSADPYTIATNSIRRANHNLLSRLLGEMSRFRFASVDDRFISELEKAPAAMSRVQEAKTGMLIQAVQYLQIKLYPEENLEESANFLESLAKFYAKSTGATKDAYAEVLCNVFEKIAGSATVEVNHPVWTSMVNNLYQQAVQNMKRSWEPSFRLSVMALCVSPQQVFSTNWMQLIEGQYNRNKSKLTPRINHILVGLAQLVWVFSTRCTESLNATTRKLESVKKLLMGLSKKTWSSLTPETTAACVSLMGSVFNSYQQYAVDELLFPLLVGANASHMTKFPHILLDSVIPERSLIAVQAFSLSLSLLQSEATLPFPTQGSMKAGSDKSSGDNELLTAKIAVSPSLQRSIDLFGECLGQLLYVLSQQMTSSEESNSRQNSMSQLVGFTTSTIRHDENTKVIIAIVKSFPHWALENTKYWEGLARQVQSPSAAVSSAAADSLRAIARCSDVLTLITVYAKTLFALDATIMTTYELPNTADFEPSLRIYVELIEIWVSRLQSGDPGVPDKNKESVVSTLWPLVEEIEGNGLYFLSSHDREVRTFALRLLWLTSELDKAIDAFAGTKSPPQSNRVIDFLEETSVADMVRRAVPRLELSMPERSRVAKFGSRRGTSVARLAGSDYGVDSALWFKIVPQIINLVLDKYPMPVAICRNIVCTRLVQMHDVILATVENSDPEKSSLIVKHPARAHYELVIEQWKLFLIVACITLTATEDQKLHVPASNQAMGHGRKKSGQKITLHHQRIISARTIFKIIIPLLGVNHPLIRDAIISGVSSINVNTYRTMLECFQPVVQKWSSVLLRDRPQTVNPSLILTAQRVVTEVTHILKLTSHHLHNPIVGGQDWIRKNILEIVDTLHSVLVTEYIQVDYNFQGLRGFFCGLAGDVVEALGGIISPAKQTRLLTTIEGWSSFGQYAAVVAEREGLMRRSSLAAAKDHQEQNLILASIEFEKRRFDLAVSRAMASLLNLALSENHLVSILGWIHTLLGTHQEVLHDTARKALSKLLVKNSTNPALIKELISRSFHGNDDNAKGIGRHYFLSIANVLEMEPDLPLTDPIEFLALAIFKLGSNDMTTRERALELIASLETRLYGGATLTTFQYKVISSTATVIKREVFHISAELAKSRPEAALLMFSHLTRAFHLVAEADRRDLIGALLPWLQNIEFAAAGGAAGSSYENGTMDPAAMMVLGNLLELTISFSDKFQHELEALWIALCTGNAGNSKNVNVILDFLFGVCLVNRNAGLIIFSRRILAYLAGSVAEPTVVDRVIRYLQPRWMISQALEPMDLSSIRAAFPYVSDMGAVAIASERALGNNAPAIAGLPSLSYGQLAAVFLSDVSSKPEALLVNAPAILHVCLCLADHFVPAVQEGVSELLVTIVSMISGDTGALKSFRRLVVGNSALRWYYDDMNADLRSHGNITTPGNMIKVIKALVQTIEKDLPEIQKDWSVEAIKWATTCPVRHIACRSFQIFRCLKLKIDQHMLADMLARLSTTISESAPDIQGFAIQILMTLNAVADSMDSATLMRFPQLFWAAAAALGTTKEREYIEALSMTVKLLQKWDFTSQEGLDSLRSSFPQGWEGSFSCLQELLFLGLPSANAYELSLGAIDLVTQLPPIDLLVDENFLPLALAANLPRFLHAMDSKNLEGVIGPAENLQRLCSELSNSAFPGRDLSGLARILFSFSKGRFWSKQDFRQQYVLALASSFPASVSGVLIMLMGTLSNKLSWVKLETMGILELLLPQVDLNNDARVSGLGADIVSPLLRLLQTDYAEQALQVLDQASAIVAGQMDKHILRMSLSSRQLAKEYEKTSTLFGIPEESGWAISKPAITATTTRNNVHSVFYTCDRSAGELTDSAMIFQFQGDEEFEYTEYANPMGHGSDNMSTSTGAAGNMDRMLSVLDDLDSFFAKAVHPRKESHKTIHGRKHSNLTESSVGAESYMDRNESISIPQLYDKKVSLILSRSLGRTPSSVSFRTSFADTFKPDRRRIQGSTSSAGGSLEEDELRLHPQPSRSSSSASSQLTSHSTLADIDSDLFQSRTPSELPSSPPKTHSEQSESSFRLESLLRGKRRTKKVDKVKRNKSPDPPPFQFP